MFIFLCQLFGLLGQISGVQTFPGKLARVLVSSRPLHVASPLQRLLCSSLTFFGHQQLPLFRFDAFFCGLEFRELVLLRGNGLRQFFYNPGRRLLTGVDFVNRVEPSLH